ncbi:MAG: glycosyltransferase [Candidatus Aminicenantes bacterium]|nr:MAG: glycosyltransferase [Candidatus Aminicenantes bacterium]
MKKKSKIIHILHHPPNPMIREYKIPENLKNTSYPFEYTMIDTFPYWIGFFRGDHHVKLAREILERTGKYQIECWRPYNNKINKIYSKNVDGILHRVFPSKEIRIPYFGTWLKSKEMLNELKREIKNNNILIHFNDGHSRFITWLILGLKNEKIPIIYQHRSSCFGIFKYKASAKKYNVTNLYVYWKELQALRYITHYFSGSMIEKKYMEEKLKIKNLSYMMDGVDFDFYKPSPDRKNLRKRLELSLNKIIILYVGRFYKDKNVDILIRCFKRIKARNNNIELMLVGGYKSDQFYQMGKEAGAIIKERTTPDRLLKYYQAVNIYVMPTFDYKVVNFGGFGSAPIEALAAGLPIITNNIIHFPGTRAERDKIGMTMESEEMIEKNINYMLNNLDKFKECRKIAKKYYDINVTMEILLNKYEELFREYYG